MDSRPLVAEEIEAGVEFISRFDSAVPVKVACWLKPSDTPRWSLYIASDSFNGGDRRKGYEEIIRITNELQDPNLDMFRIKLIESADPLAKAVFDHSRRYPGKPIRLDDTFLGNVSVDAAYIYPLPLAVSGS
jgi:hypothetical protein